MEIHGIDEAGYGPLLGPMVVARADFEVGEGQTLRLTRQGRRWVADSKVLARGGDKLARLEASVLGIVAAGMGRAPSRLDEWLALDANGALAEALDDAPWYREREICLPVAAAASDVDEVCAAMEKKRIFSRGRLAGLRLDVRPEGLLNASFEQTGNKHDTLFLAVSGLLDEVASRGGGRTITVDKLGGRDYYADKLATCFPFVPMEIHTETRERSEYACHFENGATSIRFWMKGDALAPEVSFASMAAKYTRELMMRVFNGYWSRRLPKVAATAGYHGDGRRFLDELSASGTVAPRELERLARKR